MTDLLALAAQIEAADGPSRELDEAITDALGLPLDENGYWGVRDEPPPYPYSCSIDAALTLVPEGWAWTTARYWCEGETAPPYYADCADLPALVDGQDVPVFESKAATPALALCAAALKARAGAA